MKGEEEMERKCKENKEIRGEVKQRERGGEGEKEREITMSK